MAIINHPAAANERAHLAGTLSIIAQEDKLAQAEKLDNYAQLIEARRFDLDSVPLREMMYARSEFIVNNLDMARHKPYFTRVDFREDGKPDTQVHYIGKYGVMKSGTMDVEVVDWRSPVANLYYSGQLGPMHYVCPDGEVRGELLLKRQFGIEDGELVSIFDTDVVSQDAYLQSVLGAVSHDKLREVVTTIQAEQNFVIRHKPDKPLIVQGVAGSGKTTIALHRIAYLLYAYQDKLTPEQMMIIAPNPLFLDYISGVLPDLGVDRVRQTTYTLFIESILGRAMPKVSAAARLDEVLDLDEYERDRLARILRAKGSLTLNRYIDAFIYRFERKFAEHGDVVYGPALIFSSEQVRTFFLSDARPFPLARRLKEFGKLLKQRISTAQGNIASYLNDLCAQKVERIKQREPDSPERRAKFSKLFDQRDEQLAQSKARAPQFIKEVLASFPGLAPVDIYRAFWQAIANGEVDVEAVEEEKYQAEVERAKERAKTEASPHNDSTNAGFGPAVRSGREFNPRRDGRYAGVKPLQGIAARAAAAQSRAAVAKVNAVVSAVQLPERKLYDAIPGDFCATLVEAAHYTLERVTSRGIEQEDVAPLYLLTARLNELPRADVRHTVIDEAQDFSPLEFFALHQIIGNESFTIVGDLMQGVHSYRGITAWNEVAQGIFKGDVTMHELVTSYRNTIEIMETAIKIAEFSPIPGQKRAQPVLRHGELPQVVHFSTPRDQADTVARLIREYQAAGFGTIALIGRTLADIKPVVSKLPKELGVKLMDVQKPSFSGGILAAPASSIKGLEFDCVIMLDISAEFFPMTPLHARLLYVCLTRPLHRLACLTHDTEGGEQGFAALLE